MVDIYHAGILRPSATNDADTLVYVAEELAQTAVKLTKLATLLLKEAEKRRKE